jgi:hypothetical protein
MSAGTAGLTAGAAELHCKIIPVAVVLSPFSRPAAWSTPSPPWPASPAGGVAVAASAAGGVPVAPPAASAGVAASAGSGSGCKLHRLAQAAASAMRPAFCRRFSQAHCPPFWRFVGRPVGIRLNRRGGLAPACGTFSAGWRRTAGGMGWHGLQMPAGRQGKTYGCISCLTD